MALMNGLSAAYGRLLAGLAGLAALILIAINVLIVVDVMLRNLGLQPSAHTLSLTEYGLLYVTLLGSPWLVRTHGHVYIELLTAAVSPPVRRVLGTVSYLLCVAGCMILAWYSFGVMLDDLERNALDVRSFDMPRWILFAVMPVAFLMMAGEFLRFLIGRDDLYTGTPGIHE